jgi:glutamine synthetase
MKEFKLENILAQFLSDFGLHPVVASEIEFYLFGSQLRDLSQFREGVKAECLASGIQIYNIEKERGCEQHEISLCPDRDIEKMVRDTNSLKVIITNTASKYDMQADFSAKPLADDFGSGLHIHTHLENRQEKNQFFKNDARISDTLAHALGGLLLWLPATMPLFAPHEESYRRFVPGSNVPLTVSWGANNRTVALRLPDAAHDNKRIEHRASGADADVGMAVQAILSAIHYGIKNKCQPDEQFYGDATLAGCPKPPLPLTLQDAMAQMRQSRLPFKDYGLINS